MSNYRNWMRIITLFLLPGVLLPYTRAVEPTAPLATLRVTSVRQEIPHTWQTVATLGQVYPPVDVLAEGTNLQPTIVPRKGGGIEMRVPAFQGNARDVVLQIACRTPVLGAPTRVKIRWHFLALDRLPGLVDWAPVPTLTLGAMTSSFYRYAPGDKHLWLFYNGWVPGNDPGWRIGAWMSVKRFPVDKPMSMEYRFDRRHVESLTLNGEVVPFDDGDKLNKNAFTFPVPIPEILGDSLGMSWGFGIPAGPEVSLIAIDEFTVEQQAPKRVLAQCAITLPSARRVSLIIEDGRHVGVRNLLVDRALPKGTTTIAWDGRDDLGREVFDGAYTFRMVTHQASWGFAGVTGNTSDWDDLFRFGRTGRMGNHLASEIPMSVAVLPAGAKRQGEDIAGTVLLGLCDYEQFGNCWITADGRVRNNGIHDSGDQWAPGLAAGATSNAVAGCDGVKVYPNDNLGNFNTMPVSPRPAWGATNSLPQKGLATPYAPTPGYTKDWAVFGFTYRGLAFLPGSDVLLVPDGQAGEVVWYAQDGKRLGAVPVIDPRGLVATPADADGSWTVYVAAQHGLLQFKITADWTATPPKILAPAASFAYACRVAYDPNRKWIYVSDLFNPARTVIHNQVHIFSADGAKVASLGQLGGVKDTLTGGALSDDVFAGPTGVAVDLSGDLWLCDTYGQRVLKFAIDAQGRATRKLLLACAVNMCSYWVPGGAENVMWSQSANGEMARFQLRKDQDGFYHPLTLDAVSQVVGLPPVRADMASWAALPAIQRAGKFAYWVTSKGNVLNIYRIDDTRFVPVAAIGGCLNDAILNGMPRPTAPDAQWKEKPFIWTDRNGDGKVDLAEVEFVSDAPCQWDIFPAPWMAPDGSLLIPAGPRNAGYPQQIVRFTPKQRADGVLEYRWAAQKPVLSRWPNQCQPFMRAVPMGENLVSLSREGLVWSRSGMNDVSCFTNTGQRLWSRCRELSNTQSVEPVDPRFVLVGIGMGDNNAGGQVGLYDRQGVPVLDIGVMRGLGYGPSRQHFMGDSWWLTARTVSSDEILVCASEQGWRSTLFRVKGLDSVVASTPVTLTLRGFGTTHEIDEGDMAWADLGAPMQGISGADASDPANRKAFAGHAVLRLGTGAEPFVARWHLGLLPAGKYRIGVMMPYVKQTNCALSARYVVHHAGKDDTVILDLTTGSFQMAGAAEEDPESKVINPGTPKTVWLPLGDFAFDGKTPGSVSLLGGTPNVIVDAIRVERAP